jgi:hypothetical protein
MTIQISVSQIDQLQDSNWGKWVDLHRQALQDLLPDVAAAYPGAAFAQRVDILLRRVDLHGMLQQEETVPYCYASLTLGVGFEAQPRYPWAQAAMALQGPARGEAIWDGLEAQSVAVPA